MAPQRIYAAMDDVNLSYHSRRSASESLVAKSISLKGSHTPALQRQKPRCRILITLTSHKSLKERLHGEQHIVVVVPMGIVQPEGPVLRHGISLPHRPPHIIGSIT